jgi:ferredoxin
MTVTINDTEVHLDAPVTLLEAARGAGFDIPSLCRAGGDAHRPSCMVCAVKNLATGEMLPSCSTIPAEGMRIDTGGDDVRLVRRLSLELLLSDHRADCDAPCTSVCPHGLDIELMLRWWDEDNRDKAGRVVAAAFDLPEVPCGSCKAPCEKACRRRMTGGAAVDIREIVGVLAIGASPLGPPKGNRRAVMYQSRIGVLSGEEARRIDGSTTSDSGCLHCACGGRDKCLLRVYATNEGIKRPRYNLSSAAPVMQREHIAGRLWFERSKCIRCALCVAATTDGFTFSGRGFDMQIVLPEKSRANVEENVAEICPTGALYLK